MCVCVCVCVCSPDTHGAAQSHFLPRALWDLAAASPTPSSPGVSPAASLPSSASPAAAAAADRDPVPHTRRYPCVPPRESAAAASTDNRLVGGMQGTTRTLTRDASARSLAGCWGRRRRRRVRRSAAESLVGHAKVSLWDAASSPGDAESSLGDATSSLGDTKSSLGDV